MGMPLVSGTTTVIDEVGVVTNERRVWWGDFPATAYAAIDPEQLDDRFFFESSMLIELSLAARMPVIIQGLGARSKVDAPTAGWDNAKRFVDDATARGAAVYSMAMSKPFNRTFDLAAGTKLYEGALQLNRLFTEAGWGFVSVNYRLSPKPLDLDASDAAAAAVVRVRAVGPYVAGAH